MSYTDRIQQRLAVKIAAEIARTKRRKKKKK